MFFEKSLDGMRIPLVDYRQIVQDIEDAKEEVREALGAARNTARKAANELLRWYRSNYDKLGNPPIDVVDIARKMGFFVFQASFDGPYHENLSGYIRAEEGIKEICVNQNDVPTRQRFTVAHELGHFHLHRIGDEITHITKRSQHSSLQENEADIFAEELIMPEVLLRKEHSKLLFPTIKDLAKTFAVSYAAMRMRLRKLGLGVYNDFT